MATPIDREKLLSLTVGRPRGDGDRRETTREWRSEDGERHMAVTDELNTTITQHARGDRQDVLIRPDPVALQAHTGE